MQNTDGHQLYLPSELLDCFKKKTMQCMDGGQHDSHELLRHLLEIVRNEDLRVSFNTNFLIKLILYMIFSTFAPFQENKTRKRERNSVEIVTKQII